MFQDEVLWAMQRVNGGFDVWDMDIVSFDSLYQSMRKNDANDLIRSTYSAAWAAHDPSGLDKFLKPWKELADNDQGNDEAAFLAKFGKGF